MKSIDTEHQLYGGDNRQYPRQRDKSTLAEKADAITGSLARLLHGDKLFGQLFSHLASSDRFRCTTLTWL
jgi:hypothetical protein